MDFPETRYAKTVDGVHIAYRLPARARSISCGHPGEDHVPWVGDSDSILREIETFATQTWPQLEG